MPGKVVAQLIGHAKVETTLNVPQRSSTVRSAGPPTPSDPNRPLLFITEGVTMLAHPPKAAARAKRGQEK